MNEGDLVWWDGFYHKVAAELRGDVVFGPKDYAFPGIIIKQISSIQYEVMVLDRLIVADIGMLIPFQRENECI